MRVTWILRSSAAGAPPGPHELAGAASELDLEVDPALERLAIEDLVRHEPAAVAAGRALFGDVLKEA